MRYRAPRIEIDLDKLAHNARKQTALYGSKGISVTAVTKGVCGSPKIASALLDSGIHSFGDSRIANIQKMREAGLEAQFMLIRAPMPSEVEQVVEFIDVSLNTEISVIRLLARQAAKRGKIQQIILMIDLGDLREGILPSDVEPMVAEVMGLRGVKLRRHTALRRRADGGGSDGPARRKIDRDRNEPGLFRRGQANRGKHASVVRDCRKPSTQVWRHF